MAYMMPPTASDVQPPTDLTAVSLFAGVGGIDLALTRAGVNVTAAVEIDTAARGVIADRMPETTLFPDVTKVTADELLATGFDPRRGVLAGGFPCQDLSVAGRRKGLGGSRSGLFWHIMRLADALQPQWLLLENVPGLLSSNDGRDMGTILAALGESGYGFAYRVLDAEFFGVPQRRDRVFIVGCLGDARRPVEVLLEPESSGRNHPTRREARARVAATLTAGTSRPGVSAPGRRQEDDTNLVVAHETGQGWWKEDDRAGTLRAEGENRPSRPSHIVVSALTANCVGTCGVDDNQAQAGHVIVAQPVSAAGNSVAATLTACGGPEGGRVDKIPAVCITGDTAHTLTAEGHDASEDGTGRGTPVIAFAWQAGGNNSASGAFSVEQSPTLPKSQTMAVQTETAVRRLTPMECERLQGFPDDWTMTSNGKPQADSARYRQMGNAVAVPCVEWIAKRIVRSEVAQ